MDVIHVAARFDYYKHDDDELTFKKGDKFVILEKCATAAGWFVVERLDGSKECGLAPGNYFRVLPPPREPATALPRDSGAGKVSPRPVVAAPTEKVQATLSPRPAELIVKRVERKTDGDNDEDDGALSPPPLPGPPPKWSDTLAGQEAAKMLALAGVNVASAGKRSPRSVVGVFDPQPRTTGGGGIGGARDPQGAFAKTGPPPEEPRAADGAAAWGVALKKSPRNGK